MKKKPAKRKATKGHATIADVALHLEAATLRRNRDQQRRLVTLGRDVKRAIQRANVVRVETARALLEDSPFCVYGTEEIDRIMHYADQLRETNRNQSARIEAQRVELEAALDRIAQLEGELERAHASPAAGSGR